jgi:tetratricopeptide (TPR) repeat protein
LPQVSQSDFVTRGQALVSSGQYQEAVKVCRLGLLGRPTTVEGRIVLGQALLALKRYDEVLAEMRVALELDHASIIAQTLKGEALLRKGDGQGAADVLQRVRGLAPTDPRIANLLAEAEELTGRPRRSASHPAVNFVHDRAAEEPSEPTEDAAQSMTKAYVGGRRDADEEETGNAAAHDEDPDSGGSFTRPTSLSAPAAKKRSQPQPAQPTPPPAVLAVGDRSGTVEVDPELDGVEVGLTGSDDDDDVAAPPVSKRRPAAKPTDDNARGKVIRSSRAPAPAPIPARGLPAPRSRAPLPGPRGNPSAPRKAKAEVSSVELDSDDVEELDETHLPPEAAPARGSRGSSAVRAAVNMPSGPLDAPRLPPPAMRQTALPQPVPTPPHLAQLIANAPHVMQVQPLPPLPPANPRSAIAAALPTQAAMPVPSLAAVRPTLALTPAQEQSAAVVDDLFASEEAPAWARSTMAAGGPGFMPQPLQPVGPGIDPMMRPSGGIDPQIAALLAGEGSAPAAVAMVEPSQSQARPLRAGVRRSRSKLAVLGWILLGALVIGGGVLAGLYIRDKRLDKQIVAAREQAVAVAKADTWQGWVGARDRLAGIAQASSTVGNRAALARTRALVAYEFGDGIAEARAAFDGLGGRGGLSAQLAAAYLALAQNDAAAARKAAEAAVAGSANDASAHYVLGHAHLLAGDVKGATASLKTALDREARPLYALGLARAHAAGSQWDEAVAAVDRALVLTPDHPGALIDRAVLLSASGRIGPSSAATPAVKDLRTRLEKVIAEGAKPSNEQARGVSPMQVALAHLALARLDQARGDLNAAQIDTVNAQKVNIEDQRFAEELAETHFALMGYPNARFVADLVLKYWPDSRRGRTLLAQLAFVEGRLQDAIAVIDKNAELAQYPRALALRGQIKLVLEDTDGAKADFEAALKRAPSYEPALIGRATIDLRAKELESARKRIEPKFTATNAPTPALAAAYAAVLRATGTPADRDTAKTILDKAVAAAPSLDVARAHVERGRLFRDLGQFDDARKAFAEAQSLGSWDARLETALLAIEDRDPSGGRSALDKLVAEAGDRIPPGLVIETARARILDGDHPGALAMFEIADKTVGLPGWMLERERGRLALRKSDFPGAVTFLARAIEKCGDDADTFLLAADAASDGRLDDKQGALLARVKALAPNRLAKRPEALIVKGKVALADNDYDAAAAAFEAARNALQADKATPRRLAQANFGRAVAAYFQKDDPTALMAFDNVTNQDPSIYAAYQFIADMLKNRDLRRAFDNARLAVRYNPDLVEGWVMYGTLAARRGDRKVLSDAITRLGELAPGTDELRQLRNLR